MSPTLPWRRSLMYAYSSSVIKSMIVAPGGKRPLRGE
jgi:hypothetical protein